MLNSEKAENLTTTINEITVNIKLGTGDLAVLLGVLDGLEYAQSSVTLTPSYKRLKTMLERAGDEARQKLHNRRFNTKS